jgi:hypothetical protein
VLDHVLLDRRPVDPRRHPDLTVFADVGPLDEQVPVLVDRIGREQPPALPEERRQVAELGLERL